MAATCPTGWSSPNCKVLKDPSLGLPFRRQKSQDILTPQMVTIRGPQATELRFKIRFLYTPF